MEKLIDMKNETNFISASGNIDYNFKFQFGKILLRLKKTWILTPIFTILVQIMLFSGNNITVYQQDAIQIIQSPAIEKSPEVKTKKKIPGQSHPIKPRIRKR
jgi:hypothetical protein